jgi:hypothetical protein
MTRIAARVVLTPLIAGCGFATRPDNRAAPRFDRCVAELSAAMVAIDRLLV